MRVVPEPRPTEVPVIPVPRISEAALADLEIEAWYRLHQLHLCVPGKADVSRTPDGEVLVSARAESESRRSAMLAALQSWATTPGVRLDVAPQSPEARSGGTSERPASEYIAAAAPIGVQILRDHFAARLGRSGNRAAPDDTVETLVGEFTTWAVARS